MRKDFLLLIPFLPLILVLILYPFLKFEFAKKVYVIKITKPILYSDLDIDGLYYFLKHFKGDGLILYIDSPGGGLETYKIVKALKNLSVPKVCYIHYKGVSGAYWICSQADYIISEDFSIVGSIGGIAMEFNFANLLRKLGINVTIVKTGKYKDVLNPFRKLTKEDIEFIRKKLDLFVNEFKKDVLRKRNIANVSDVFSAKWYFGKEAIKLGLVDELGDYEKAKEKIREMLNTTNVIFIEKDFSKKKNFLENLIGSYLLFPLVLLI